MRACLLRKAEAPCAIEIQNSLLVLIRKQIAALELIIFYKRNKGGYKSHEQ
ncbi:hypothetical protein KIS1582_0489 [Cytobacillus firmus]|uniref:Uncharacterized protein n=1 Tax=Cytobacillus firmus TaxID=1399 RepID=A0A800NFW1_CYTFI|nr:hypothetical protein KIS1582_0489 [Cytobacillus firmus]